MFAGISGDGFQAGGANDTRLNGTWDVALQKGEVILVTHSYRVNIFGFLAADVLRLRDREAGSTGNYGIQDQRMAMKWTFENIADFGGNPSSILIAGQSAGGNSVSQHLVRPASWNYFSSAAMLSGVFADGTFTPRVEDKLSNWNRSVSQHPPHSVLQRLCCCSTTDCRQHWVCRVLDRLNCSHLSGFATSTEQVRCVVRAPAAAFLAADLGDHHPWGITVDDVDLTAPGPVLASQGNFHAIPIIVGSTRDDLTTNYHHAVVGPVGAEPRCRNRFQCTEEDFRTFGEVTLGLEPTYLAEFVSTAKPCPNTPEPT